MKQTIRLTESNLRSMIQKAVNEAISRPRRNPTRLAESKLKNMIQEAVKSIINENYYGEDTTPQEVMRQIDSIVSRGREFAFDIEDLVDEDGDPYGWCQLGYDPKKNILYGGGVMNAGVIREFKMEYDHSTSLDDNLTSFYEQIQQELLNKGYHWSDDE